MIHLHVLWPKAPPEVIDKSEADFRLMMTRSQWILTLRHRYANDYNSELIATATCDTKEEAEALALTIKDVLHARSST